MGLDVMMQNEFLSMGGDCQPAHHVRRLTNVSTAGVFDWLITPIRSIIPMIETHFEDSFEHNQMSWLEVDDGWHVTDERYGVICMHHFKSRDEQHINTIVSDIRRRGLRLIERLKARKPLVFVRRWHTLDVDAGVDEALKLHRFLHSHNANSVFLYLQSQSDLPPHTDGNFLICHNPQFSEEWTGDSSLYDQYFAMADQLVLDVRK